MRMWPRSLAARLACALLLAAGTVVVLSLVVENFETVPKPTKRASGLEALVGGSVGGAANPKRPAGDNFGGGGRDPLVAPGRVLANNKKTQMATTTSLPPTARQARSTTTSRASYEVARRLRPTKGTILLAHRESSLAPDVLPVVEILASGELVLRRPEPRASGPLQASALSGEGHGAGVVLPAQNLEKLSPAARGALIALLQQWLLERPVSPAKLQSSDILMSKAAVRRLLSWVP